MGVSIAKRVMAFDDLHFLVTRRDVNVITSDVRGGGVLLQVMLCDLN
jgi:hypothetical protein